MPILEFIKPGMLTTIQDLGRKGGNYYAIPASGAMDRNAAAIALLLLQEPLESAVIECTSIAPSIRFHGPTQFALTGADFQWTLNERPVGLNAVLHAESGDVLSGKNATDQLRGYIAVKGIWQGKPVYGSYSTYLNGKFGGYQGRQIQKGDRLEWLNEDFKLDDLPVILVQKGPEFELLTEAAQTDLFTNAYEIGAESNRMGARLLGPKLESPSYQLENSVPVLPGFIQLPPNGQPIVVLQDGQVSGGYPRIAYVLPSHLSLFNQIPLGKKLRFQLA